MEDTEPRTPSTTDPAPPSPPDPPRSVFDELTSNQPDPRRPSGPAEVATGDTVDHDPPTDHPAGEVGATPIRIKQAVQELLKLGTLYAATKPNLYQVAISNRQAIAAILEPLDLSIRVDEVRGLAILAIGAHIKDQVEEPGDDWQHPLVRRQRLTLAQSLLVALLRRHYVEHEKTGAGLDPPQVAVEDLVPELQPYLGDEGSEAGELSRIRRLLEQLKDHGIVSPITEDDLVTIRPLICHLADPASLQLLLEHYERLTADAGPERSELAEVGDR